VSIYAIGYLIEQQRFSIGLDKRFFSMYIKIMSINKLLQGSKLNIKTKMQKKKEDLIMFTGEQFNRLIKKNLNLPIKLYHL